MGLEDFKDQTTRPLKHSRPRIKRPGISKYKDRVNELLDRICSSYGTNNAISAFVDPEIINEFVELSTLLNTSLELKDFITAKTTILRLRILSSIIYVGVYAYVPFHIRDLPDLENIGFALNELEDRI